MPKIAVGIDLGTTNTVVAVDGKVLPITSAGGLVSSTLPSCVAYLDSGEVVVGDDAKARQTLDPENTVVAAKRVIGRAWDSATVSEYRQRYPTKVVNDKERGPAFQTRAGLITPIEVSTAIIAAALRGAGLDPANTYAVITVPAAFSAGMRAATERAGHKAGLADVAILDEPVATALAHGANRMNNACVYDIGGGTFDLCVLDCSLYPIGILAHGGDLFLGGDNFDEALAAHFAAVLLREHRVDLRKHPTAFHALIVAAEQAKRALSTAETETVKLDLSRVDPGGPMHDVSVNLTRFDIIKTCYNLVRRTFRTCDAVFEDLGMSPLSMDAVFMAGGATLMPMVREWVVTYFGVAPIPEISPFEVVARGASIAAREAFFTRL